MRCHYSNRIECLYEQLKHNLFSNSSKDPFAKRLILVASPAMRSWIQMRLASDPQLQIAAGIEIGLAESTIDRWTASPKGFPSPNALAFAIEASLLEDPIPNLPSHLAPKLAELFRRYGIYGSKLIEQWERDQPTTGQGALWNRLFEANEWSYPAKNLLNEPTRSITSIHLFGASFVPKCYLQFLQRMSENYAVHTYMLSPCRAFWLDIMAEKQQGRLLQKLLDKGVPLQQQLTLESQLEEANPLLANFGTLGREMASVLEACDDHPTQDYVLPNSVQDIEDFAQWVDSSIHLESISHSLNLLEAVQADITLLRPAQLQKIELPDSGKSLQIHAVPSRWREVQVLYNELVDQIKDSLNTDDPIQPGDIFVMAPDISAYIPYMRAVFEAPGSLLSLQVMDLRLPSQSPYIQAYIDLLNLGSSAWETESVLDLLDLAPFIKKQGWTREEALTIRRWTQGIHIHWGFDLDHRDDYLKGMHCEKPMLDRTGRGTWSNGLDRLTDGLFLSLEDELPILEVSEGPLLGRWWEFLHTLKRVLQPITKQEKKTSEEWIALLRDVANEFLDPETDSESQKAAVTLQQTLQTFAQAIQSFKDLPLEFKVIKKHLLDALENVTVTFREGNLQAVRCCSMLPMRTVPAKVIALLGMDADSFPKRGSELLGQDQLIATGKGDYCPRPNDFDRYLFLEALLSSRQRFMLFFPGRWCHSSHSNEKLPSPLLKELVSYLDKSYSLSGKKPSEVCIIEHPLESYHASYFNGSLTPSYVQTQMNWAYAHYFSAKERSDSFLGDFTQVGGAIEGPQWVVRLKDLQNLAGNPLKEYFKGVLNTHPDRIAAKHEKISEPLELSRMDAGLLRRRTLELGGEAALRESFSKGMMPLSPLKEIFLPTLEHEIQALQKLLNEVGIEAGNSTKIILSGHSSGLIQHSDRIELPPLIIQRPSGGVWSIEGEIPLVYTQGLVVYSENTWNKLLKVWPCFLIYCALVDKYQLPFSKALLPVYKEQKDIVYLSPYLTNPMQKLTSFLEYYESTRHHPSPLMPDWLEAIIQGDQEKLQKQMDQIFQSGQFNYTDETAQWLFNSDNLPDAEGLIRTWQPIAHQLFDDLYQAWGKK